LLIRHRQHLQRFVEFCDGNSYPGSMVLDTQKEPAKRQITPKKTNKNFTLFQAATNIKKFLQDY